MKISTSTVKLFNHFGMQTGMRLLADAGFEAIDFYIGKLPWTYAPYQNTDPKDIPAYCRQVSRTAKDHGLDIFQSHAHFPLKTFDTETDPVMLSNAILSVYAAGYLDCPNIVFHPVLHPEFNYGNNDDACREVNLDFFSAMVPALKDTGVTLCIENMFAGENGKPKIPNACSDPEQLINLIDTLNQMHGPHFAACLDTGHATVVGQDPAEMLRKLGARTRVIHIHDNDCILDQHWLPGLGNIHWGDVMQALADIGYTGTFNTEVSTFFARCTKEGECNRELALDVCKRLYAVSRKLAEMAEK